MPRIGGHEPLGSSEKWRRLVADLKVKGNVDNPYAVATAQAKKYAAKRGWTK